MSFKCKNCGTVSPGRKQHRVITEIRDVTYLIQIRTLTSDGGDTTKMVKKTNGKEIVSEDIYCRKCVPKEIIPKIIEKVERKNVVAIRRVRKRGY